MSRIPEKVATREAFCAGVFAAMVRLYGEPGVGALCLEAQEAHNVDVPSLLFFVLADYAGHGAVNGDMQRLLAGGADWRSLYVLPLHNLRLALRRNRKASDNELYEKIKGAELEAERLQVERLADHFRPLEGPCGLAARYLAGISIPEPEAQALLDQLQDATNAMHCRLPTS